MDAATTRASAKQRGPAAPGALILCRPGPRSRLEENFADSLAMLRALGQMQCTQAEAAAALLVSRRSLQRFLAAYPEAVEAFDAGALQGRVSLRRAQWRSAERGNTAMLIWLGKQWLGQRDKHEIDCGMTHEEALRQLA